MKKTSSKTVVAFRPKHVWISHVLALSFNEKGKKL
jgi:hypothetical protein